MEDKQQQSEPAVDPLKVCESQRDEYLNGWKRAAADLANYKKDEGSRFTDFAGYNSERILREILPVLDSFSLALDSVKGNESAEKGLLMIKSQLEDFLKRQNVERIKVSPGDPVDLNIHELVLGDEGNIIEELSPGYKLNGKVIRAVKVKIGK